MVLCFVFYLNSKNDKMQALNEATIHNFMLDKQELNAYFASPVIDPLNDI